MSRSPIVRGRERGSNNYAYGRRHDTQRTVLVGPRGDHVEVFHYSIRPAPLWARIRHLYLERRHSNA